MYIHFFIFVSQLQRIIIPDPPSVAYEEQHAIIGGIGKTIRWNVTLSRKDQTISYLKVTNLENIEQLRHFVHNKLEPFGFLNEVSPFADGHRIDIPDPLKTTCVASGLHCGGYQAILCSENGDALPRGKLSVERYDRSEHMWWNQTQMTAGPLRDVHRWHYPHIPEEWKHIPFTWEALCQNITIQDLDQSIILPLPLRDHYLSSIIHELNSQPDLTDDQTKRLTQAHGLRSSTPCVTCRLSEMQNRGLLRAFYWSHVAPFDAKILHISHLVQFRYMLFGHTAREMGKYQQEAKHLGHGAHIRRFKNKTQYSVNNMNSSTLNRIYQTDGSLRGSGFKGTRGKYGHKDFEKYEPSKRMRRTKRDEHNIRNCAINHFSVYRTNQTSDACSVAEKSQVLLTHTE